MIFGKKRISIQFTGIDKLIEDELTKRSLKIAKFISKELGIPSKDFDVHIIEIETKSVSIMKNGEITIHSSYLHKDRIY